MPRVSEESFRRNREAQRKRNITSNANRSRSFGKLDSDIRKSEKRKFIGWDGEGHRIFSVHPSGEIDIEHHYLLFGCSEMYSTEGISLSTVECLELILMVEGMYPDAHHVGFAFEYDVNMILKDLPWRFLAMLHDAGAVKWKGYKLKHTPHKSFSVSKHGLTATIYDVFGFFHSKYITALKKHGIGTEAQRSHIQTGKDSRGTFTYSDLPMVKAYWSVEISLLPELMDKLRDSCYTAGFFITKWHGPGALAEFALRKYKVYDWKAGKVPAGVKIARQYAYAGGRFQAWKCGYRNKPAYTADINSAYAYAISLLPRLDNGKWVKRNTATIASGRDICHFGLYRIRFDARGLERRARNNHIPFPLFHRDSKGNLTWPPYTEGWYWSPEASLVAGSEYATFLEAWEFKDDGTRPFDFVRGAYDRRVQLQQAGDPTQAAYKWFLASIYGQFARRVGWDKSRRTAPRSHQLEWAGYITSYCRALVYRAAIDVARKGALISIDTDGVTSTVPFDPDRLPGGTGTGLGQWKLESFTEILYWQNGIYWLRNADGEWKDPKTRGIPRGSLLFSDAMACYANVGRDRGNAGSPSVHLTRNKFIGYRQALNGRYTEWRRWQTEPVDVVFGGSGKGRHVRDLCRACRGRDSTRDGDSLHDVLHLYSGELYSQPHYLPWLQAEHKEENIEYRDARELGIFDDDDGYRERAIYEDDAL